MKFIILILCLFASQSWGRSSNVKYRVLRRKCEAACKVFGSMLEIRYSTDTNLAEKEVKNILAEAFRITGANKEILVPAFLSKMDGIMEHVNNKEEGRKLCRKVKICKIKQYLEPKRSPGPNQCKLCQLVTSVVRDSITIFNTTFQSFSDLADKSCKLFSGDKRTLVECLKIVEKIRTVENIIVKEPNPKRFCQAIGLCANASIIGNECVEGLQSISPWQTALSLLRKGTSLMVGKAEDAGSVITSIRQEPLFENLKRCMNDAWVKPTSGRERKRRSIEESECPICDRLDQVLTSEVEESSKGLGEQLQRFCDQIKSPSQLSRCRVIVHLANTTSTIPQFIMSKELCRKMACPKAVASPNSCKVCKEVQNMIGYELKYVKTMIDMVSKEVADICKQFLPSGGGAKCQAISLMVEKIGDAIVDAFNIKKICTKIGLC